MGAPVVQWQMLSKDPDRTVAFYTGLFGWRTDADNPLGYRRLDPGEGRGIPGGVWPSPPEGRSFVQLFIEVADVEAVLARAQELGASVVIPPQTLPEGQRMAVLLDPLGVPFAVTTAG